MKRILLAAILLVSPVAAFAQGAQSAAGYVSGGGGSSLPTPVSGANGGTGVANTGLTITLGASVTTTGAGAPTLAFPGSPATYTYPTTTATLARTDAGQTFTGVQNFGAGSAGTPNLAVGNATTGFYSASTTGFGIAVNGASKLDFGVTVGTLWTINATLIPNVTNSVALGTASLQYSNVFGVIGTFSNYVLTTPTTVNSLPSCTAGLDGARSFVTNNATAVSFQGAVTTGGSNHTPVYCDGSATAWKQG